MSTMEAQSTKLGFFGLDNSGKTSYLKTLKRDFTFIANPKPTKGIERTSISQSVIWDYGGQEAYRQRYLASETDLEDLNFAFYLVDVQDSNRFQDSANYLNNLLQANEKIGNELAICLHKADPDITGTALQDNISMATEIFSSIVPEATPFFLTSIFFESSLRRTFSFGLQRSQVAHEKIQKSLEKILRKTGGLSAVLINPEPLLVGSAALDSEFLEVCEELGLTMTEAWERAAPILSEIKHVITTQTSGKTLFLPIKMEGQKLFLLTYAPQLPGASFDGWLDACKDELKDLGIEL